MRHQNIIALLLSLVLGTGIAFAASYSEKIEVPSRSPAELPVYLANGLNQLVNRITNNPAAEKKSEVVKAQPNVLEYVLSYQYVTEPDPLNPQANKLFLKIDFDTRAVDKLLRQAKLSLPETKEDALALQENQETKAKSNSNDLTLVVDNIEEVGDYKEVMNYLSGFDAISDIQVTELAPPHVTFDLTVQGGQEHLKQLMLLGNVLVPEVKAEFPQEISEAPQTLKYRYQR